MVKPAARREVVRHLRARFEYSERRACGLIRMDRSSCRYRPRERGDDGVRQRLVELAAELNGEPTSEHRDLTREPSLCDALVE